MWFIDRANGGPIRLQMPLKKRVGQNATSARNNGPSRERPDVTTRKCADRWNMWALGSAEHTAVAECAEFPVSTFHPRSPTLSERADMPSSKLGKDARCAFTPPVLTGLIATRTREAPP